MNDPYQILGVERSATEKEIKSAYRKLAKKLHPDRNKDNPRGAERFAEVTKAYDLLSDNDRRARYNRGEIDADGNPQMPYGFGGSGATGGYNPHSSTAGGGRFDFGGGGVDIGDLFDGLFAGRQRSSSQQRPMEKGANVQYRAQVSLTDMVKRKAQRLTLRDGKSIEFNLPKGVDDGTQLRLANKGERGLGGFGDALITISLKSHNYFRKDGDHIRLDLPISIREAISGSRIKVPTADGFVMLNIPERTSSGKILRLKGKGFERTDGSRGDQLITVMITLPEILDENWLEFVKRLDDDSDIRRHFV